MSLGTWGKTDQEINSRQEAQDAVQQVKDVMRA